MSELKAYTYDDMIDGDADTNIEYYPKSEADKVIANLEDELRAANEQIENLINSASSIMLFQDRVNDNKCDELRHQKYKRCLAMAWWCSAELGMLVSTWESKIKYYKRWQKRWLELAEKFKEGV